MPATTTRGFPYAVPADARINWPATSQALAELLEALVSRRSSGQETVPTTPQWKSVAFPPGHFTATPIVVCQANNGDAYVITRNTTAAGFEYVCNPIPAGGSLANIRVDWIAIQP